MGVIGYLVRLIHIPVNNLLVGMARGRNKEKSGVKGVLMNDVVSMTLRSQGKSVGLDQKSTSALGVTPRKMEERANG